MNSLMNYGSDGENSNDSEDSKESEVVNKTRIPARTTSETIYDPVPMDMSEESNNNESSDESQRERSPDQLPASSNRTGSKNTSVSNQRRKSCKESSSPYPEHKHGERIDDGKDKHERSNKHDSKKVEEKKHSHDSKSNKDSKRHREDDKKSRDDDKRFRDHDRKSRDNERKKEKSCKEDDRSERGYHQDRREKRDDRDRRREKDKERDRERDRERNRDRSSKDKDRDRERRNFRDEKSRDRYRDERREGDKNRGRSRSRSIDRETRPFSFRDERSKSKLAQLEKLGIEIKVDDAAKTIQEQSFYNPLATASQGKYAEQIQKRKLLWANKKTEETKSTTTAPANSWVGTTFTHDQDGKVTAKFKRLMGIKGDLPSTTSGQKPDILKKQEEMFSNMEQQYEVARATTHTQRGVGLGYASGSYPFTR